MLHALAVLVAAAGVAIASIGATDIHIFVLHSCSSRAEFLPLAPAATTTLVEPLLQ